MGCSPQVFVEVTESTPDQIWPSAYMHVFKVGETSHTVNP